MNIKEKNPQPPEGGFGILFFGEEFIYKHHAHSVIRQQQELFYFSTSPSGGQRVTQSYYQH
jgi:hypothetical protein